MRPPFNLHMTDHTTSDAALKAVKRLRDKYGYVVVCILPGVKDRYPKGKMLEHYANVPLFGWFLRVDAQTRAADFVAQCEYLLQENLLKSAARAPQDGSRFFRCKLELDDDVPF